MTAYNKRQGPRNKIRQANTVNPFNFAAIKRVHFKEFKIHCFKKFPFF